MSDWNNDHLLWDIVIGWLIEKNFNFKTIAVVDGYPIYQVEPYDPKMDGYPIYQVEPSYSPKCISYMLITTNKVQITSTKIEISNFMGLQDLTFTGPPVKTIMAGHPTFFEEMEQYLNRDPQPPINYAPTDGGLQILSPQGGPSINFYNCLFNGYKINGPIKGTGTIFVVFAPVDSYSNIQFHYPPNYQAL
jgi:hypothetical protein